MKHIISIAKSKDGMQDQITLYDDATNHFETKIVSVHDKDAGLKDK
jgi:hypothetical protein